MKINFTPNNPTLRIIISSSEKHNQKMPLLYNVTKTQIVDKHKLPANYNNSDRGYILLPRATREILSELKKHGIQYRAKVI